MDLVIDDHEVEEVLIEDLVKSDDRGLIIPDRVGDRSNGKSELEKSIIANDAIELGPSRAARIHGVPQSSASKYADGLDVKEDVKEQILNKKHEIGNLAVTKLMNSLDLFEPSEIDKPLDQVKAAGQLATIVEKMSGNRNGDGAVHVHFHPPRQKSESDYEVIDV